MRDKGEKEELKLIKDHFWFLSSIVSTIGIYQYKHDPSHCCLHLQLFEPWCECEITCGFSHEPHLRLAKSRNLKRKQYCLLLYKILIHEQS